ncbi:hypothetical protein ACN4EK_26695 [Pantanalinema rosaneae CENA516]|uniref:hypothetical protein n=1 Tax=Pantanalinema rosaneae TaxID=1620701 RepID=UPI003D6F7CA8
MKPAPDDDPRLVEFLRQHRPPVPPAASELEEQLMATIATTPQSTEPPGLRLLSQRSSLWLIPPVIAAGIVGTVISLRLLSPSPSPEFANLETFVDDSYTPVSGRSIDDDPFWLETTAGND